MATEITTENETFATVKEAAEFLRWQFEDRDDKPGQRFLKEGSPKWCSEAIGEATEYQGNLDLCYDLVEAGADWIADCDDIDDANDLFDDARPEGDIYNADCTRWLAMDIDHIALVNDAQAELGTGEFDLISVIQDAQSRQKEQVFTALWDWLNNNVVTEPETNDDDDDE